jgi:ornithine cyclodeaminase
MSNSTASAVGSVIRYLSEADIATITESSTGIFVEAVKTVLGLRAQDSRIIEGAVVMPVYPVTHHQAWIMERRSIICRRAAAVAVVVSEHLGRRGFRSVGLVGCKDSAATQVLAMLAHFPEITNVHVFDASREIALCLAADVRLKNPTIYVHVEETARACVSASDIVLSCAVADTPYIEFEWLLRGALICSLPTMDVKRSLVLLSDKIIVDDWHQLNRESGMVSKLVSEGHLSREQVHAELGEILVGAKTGRESDGEIILFQSSHMIIADMACATAILDVAVTRDLGRPLRPTELARMEVTTPLASLQLIECLQ